MYLVLHYLILSTYLVGQNARPRFLRFLRFLRFAWNWPFALVHTDLPSCRIWTWISGTAKYPKWSTSTHFAFWAVCVYSGDLNSEHLNSGKIWIMKFHLFAIQMPSNSSLFKPSVTKPISQTTYDLNSELLVRYSSHVLNNKLLVCYSSHDLNNEPCLEWHLLDLANTKLIHYSDPHCTTYSMLWVWGKQKIHFQPQR